VTERQGVFQEVFSKLAWLIDNCFIQNLDFLSATGWERHVGYCGGWKLL